MCSHQARHALTASRRRKRGSVAARIGGRMAASRPTLEIEIPLPGRGAAIGSTVPGANSEHDRPLSHRLAT